MARIVVEVRIETDDETLDKMGIQGIGEVTTTFEDPIRQALNGYHELKYILKDAPWEDMTLNIVSTGLIFDSDEDEYRRVRDEDEASYRHDKLEDENFPF